MEPNVCGDHCSAMPGPPLQIRSPVLRAEPAGRKPAIESISRDWESPPGNFEETRPGGARTVAGKMHLKRLRLQMVLEQSQSAACGLPPPQAYPRSWSCGRVAEGGGLLNRYRLVKAYRGFESLRLRQSMVFRYFPHSFRRLLSRPCRGRADAARSTRWSAVRHHPGRAPWSTAS